MARKMKDSGIEWIGEIPEDWKVVRMKSCIQSRISGSWGDNATGGCGDVICLRVADFDYNNFKFKDTQIEQLTVRNYDDDTINKLSLKPGDILIEKSGGGEKTPVGRTVIFNKEYKALYANFMDRLRCSCFIYPNFMQYIFVTFYKNNYTKNYIKQTTGIQNLDLTSMLAKELVAIPNLSEQQQIADFLDTKCAQIDEILQKTRDTIAEYKKLKQSIITQAVTKGVRGKRPMKDSGIEWIGDIPEEWEICRLRFLCRIMTGNQDTQDSNPDGEYPFYVRSPIIEKSVKYTFDGPAILMAGDGVGAGKIFHIVNGKYGCHQRVYSIQKIKNIDIKFLFHYLKNKFYIAIETANSKSTVDSVRLPMLQNFPVIIPVKNEQQEIVAYLDQKCAEIDKLIEKKEQLVGELENYKKSLIYEYVTGKKGVLS